MTKDEAWALAARFHDLARRPHACDWHIDVPATMPEALTGEPFTYMSGMQMMGVPFRPDPELADDALRLVEGQR